MITLAAWEKNVPAPESPKKRHERDVEAQRGDWQGVSGTLPNNLKMDGKLHYVADGRVDRQYQHRGGDLYYDEDGVLHNEADGRNSREYVDRTTKLSAHNGKKSRIWDSPESARQ